MKILSTAIFICLSAIVNAQTIVDQFGYASGFCSGTYYLYSDSTFYYERGCEGRGKLTFGTYKQKNDTLILYPLKQTELDIILDVEFVKNDSVKGLQTKYKSLKDSVYFAQAYYTSTEQGKKWKAKITSTDSLMNEESILLDDETGFYFKTVHKQLAVCPIELDRLTGKRDYYVLDGAYNEIIIHLKLPDEIVKLMIVYEFIYEDLKPALWHNSDRIIKVE